MKRRLIAMALACLWTVLGAAAARAQDPLPDAVQAALSQLGLGADTLGAVALPVGHGGRPWSHRAQVPMQPGSSMKVLTAAVALDRLEPDHRGSTELRSTAAIVDGALQGDLVLRGGADPELGLPQLWALLMELRESGVRHIAGDLIVDRTRFRPARFDQGLPPFDEAPEFAYNGIPDALLLGENLLPLEIRATEAGVAARSVPALPGVALGSRMVLNDRPCSDWDEDWQPARVTTEGQSTLIELQGGFPRGCTRRTALALLDRAVLTERLFAALWQGLGGTWAGRALEQAGPADSRVLARRVSRPWGEVLRHTMKTSDNTLTRLLYLELGVPAMAGAPQAPTLALAGRAVRQWLAEKGIPDDGLVLDNGSGLSRSERISAWQLARVLQVAHAGRHASELMMSLPVAGVDGTMRRRLKDSPAAGWARLKTGTLNTTTALAGYVYDDEQRLWAVSMMVNTERAGRARVVLDALVDSIARQGPHGRPALTIGPQGDGP